MILIHSIHENVFHVFDVFDCRGPLAFDDFLVVLGDPTRPAHFLDRGRLGQVDADVLLVADDVLDDPFEVLDLLEQQRHVELVVGLLARLVDLLALLPVQLDASEGLDPVVGAVLDVLEEVEVVLAHFAAVVAVVEGPLPHHQLVAVLIERS